MEFQNGNLVATLKEVIVKLTSHITMYFLVIQRVDHGMSPSQFFNG